MLSLHCEQLQEIPGSLMHQQHKNPANERIINTYICKKIIKCTTAVVWIRSWLQKPAVHVIILLHILYAI